MERSDIDIAVSGVDNFESLVEKVKRKIGMALIRQSIQ